MSIEQSARAAVRAELDVRVRRDKATFGTFEEYAKVKILISGLILDRIALVPENELAHGMADLSNDLM